jgi:hypothetical protein
MDIEVALTTTHYLKNSSIGAVMDERLKTANIPVCVAVMGLDIYSGDSTEHLEHVMAEMCKDMARTVSVIPEKSYVFVGMNPQDECTGLVVYEATDTPMSKMFFERWVVLQTMLFELQVGREDQPLFVIKGLWRQTKWDYLDVNPTSKLTIID